MRWFFLSLSLIVGAAASQERPPRAEKDSQSQRAPSPVLKKNVAGDHAAGEKPSGATLAPVPEQKSLVEHFVELGSVVVTAIATAVMAVFTARLWFSTEKLWKATRESIELARAEFISTHRPKLWVRRVSLKNIKGTDLPNGLGVEFLIVNTGDTAARIIEMSARIWFPESTENLPPIPPYGEGTFPGLTVESGDSPPLTHYESGELGTRFHMRTGFVDAGGTDVGPDLLFLGYVDYEDGVKRQRRTGFLRKYNFANKRFDPINHPDYEYQD